MGWLVSDLVVSVNEDSLTCNIKKLISYSRGCIIILKNLWSLPVVVWGRIEGKLVFNVNNQNIGTCEMPQFFLQLIKFSKWT